MGVFPVFVVDGEPSPLKSQARAARFFRGSGMDLAAFPSTEAESSVTAAPVKRRNAAFTRCVEECVELLEYLGMPVLRAKGEAEALCAQLNNEGHVGACITADSDAFLFGAKTVVKVLRSNCKEPFECYHIADIESGLGLKRKQLVAMALLIGSDHDLHGVPGFGLETALRFVQLFDEDEILDKLHEIGKGVYPFLKGFDNPHIDDLPSSSKKSPIKSPHCSHCGHPGSKKNHIKDGCNYCLVDSLENCVERPAGFKCECPSCDEARDLNEQRRHENWQIKVCKRIAAETNFPNEEIIKLYLSDNNLVEEKGVPLLSWSKPDVEALVDLLSYKQNWEPSYIRQRMLPMLSTIYLREVASSSSTPLPLCDQYEFDSIERTKIRHGHPYYLVKWKRATRGMNSNMPSKKPVTEGETSSEVVVLDDDDNEDTVVCESPELLDEPDVPQVLMDDGCCFLLTDEDIQLVGAAFPKETARFQEEQRLKEARSRSRKSKTSLADSGCETPKGPRPSGVQLSITEFYRSKKGQDMESGKKKQAGEGHAAARDGSRKSSDRDLNNKSLPKSVRRRLLFDC
ncbi:Flap endonuclease GEN-like 1 [Zea mays]|nr:Flap endonuclease GEN-like 1 [Zea mays]